MAKELSEYTAKELQDIGRKVIESRIKDTERGKVKSKLLSVLYKAWKDGKVSGPGIPPSPK